jgi:hypothetical protein
VPASRSISDGLGSCAWAEAKGGSGRGVGSCVGGDREGEVEGGVTDAAECTAVRLDFFGLVVLALALRGGMN